MNLEFENKHGVVYYDAPSDIVMMRSHMSFEHTTEQDYKDIMTAYAEVVEKYKSRRVAVDLSQGTYAATPELQEWTAEFIATRTIGAGQRVVAVVIASEIAAQMAMEQLMEEGVIANGVATRYFTDYDAAHHWASQT